MGAHFPQPRGKVSRRSAALAVLVPVACAGVILALVTLGGGKSNSAGSTNADGTGLAAYQACLAQHGVSDSVPQGQQPSQAQIQAFTDCRAALGVDPSQSDGGGGGGGFASRQQFYDCVYAAGMKAEAAGEQGSDTAVDQAVEQCREKLGMNFGGPPTQTQTQTTTPGSIA